MNKKDIKLKALENENFTKIFYNGSKKIGNF